MACLALVGAAPVLLAGACGGSRRAVGRSLSSAHPQQQTTASYRNDGDLDPNRDEDLSYLDVDDPRTIDLGGPEADASDRRAIAALVKRYYAAAGARDSGAACAMFAPGSARMVPGYGNSGLAPAYLRGGRTCTATMRRLFEHFRRELSAQVAVTDVRSRGDRALAVLGSTTMPASYVTLVRQRGRWWLEVPLEGSSMLADDPT